MAEKLEAFGAETFDIDGHNLNEIEAALNSKQSTVKAINANTKKGYGLKYLEENFLEWHRKSPNEDDFKKFLKDIYA